MVGTILGGIAGGATVVVVIKAVDRFSGTFSKATLGMKALKIGAIAGAVAVAGMGIAMVKLGKSSLDAAIDYEQTQLAFETMLGSAEKGQELLKDITDFAKRTPFTLKGVEEQTKKLLAYGVTQENILGDLKALGDIAAGVGVGKLPQLTLAFGQVKAKGTLAGQELRQFAEAGVGLSEELSKVTGFSMEEINDQTKDLGITFEQVREALQNLSGEGGRFENLMAKQAETVGGKFSNLQDTFEIMQREIGAALLPVVAQLADVLLEEVLPAVQPLIPVIGKLIADFVKFAATAIKPLMPDIIALVEQLFKLAAEILPQIAIILPPIIGILSGALKILRFILEVVTGIIRAKNEFIGFISKLGSGSTGGFGPGGFQQAGDFILQPGGRLIKTDPRDTIVGFKGSSPNTGGMTVNIEQVVGLDAEDVSRALKEELSNKIRI